MQAHGVGGSSGIDSYMGRQDSKEPWMPLKDGGCRGSTVSSEEAEMTQPPGKTFE